MSRIMVENDNSIWRKVVMRIVSFNINGFRGMQNQGEVISEEKELYNNLNEFKTFIDGIQIKEEDVIILQEIPHKILVNRKWEERSIFQKFKYVFGKDYTIFYPKFLIDSNQCTIALASKETNWTASKKNIIEYDRFHSFGNKLIEIEKGNDILLGVHINPEMWNMIVNSLKKEKVTFVVGDFNAYEERGEMKNKPSILRGLGYNSFIPSNVITYFEGKSSVDNFYVNKDRILKHGIRIEVKKTESFISDHACCTLEI